MQSQYLSHSLTHAHTHAELGYKLKQGGEWNTGRINGFCWNIILFSISYLLSSSRCIRLSTFKSKSPIVLFKLFLLLLFVVFIFVFLLLLLMQPAQNSNWNLFAAVRSNVICYCCCLRLLLLLLLLLCVLNFCVPQKAISLCNTFSALFARLRCVAAFYS